ncbi:hypothetical protein GsuE55_08060 [Geobacillus subterraneus]|uniref:Uncharacterized protein n=1 Tax=Geobacillus subterraneus TaxID=129338 RepID=A0A679FJP0_9BACL|nr:hypothetical protein GsuE55_08060 [Geobacillus subterraneus]
MPIHDTGDDAALWKVSRAAVAAAPVEAGENESFARTDWMGKESRFDKASLIERYNEPFRSFIHHLSKRLVQNRGFLSSIGG